MDVTPLIPADRQVIDSYGARRLSASAASRYEGAILVFPDATAALGGARASRT